MSDEKKKCDCGRTLTSTCNDWCKLSEEDWKKKLLMAVQGLTGFSKQREVERRRKR